MTEHDNQTALFARARLMENEIPNLRMMFAVPNEGYGGNTQELKRRAMREGKRRKDEGRKAGVCDVLLPVPCDQFAGFAFEMKYGRGALSPMQMWWIESFRSKGWLTMVYYDWEQAWAAVLSYLNQPGIERWPAPKPYPTEFDDPIPNVRRGKSR